jgi:hypothetical protein
MSIEKTPFELPCPGGSNSRIKTTYGKLANSQKMKSSKGHQYVFQSADRSKLRNAMKNYDKAVNNFNEVLGDLIANADRVIKG